MGAAALPAVLGAGSLLLGAKQASDSQKAANKAAKGANALTARQSQLFDTLSGIVQDADKSGQFDPQKQLDQLGTDTAYYSQRDTQNAAGAAATLGYHPGDTAPLQQIRSIDNSYKLQYGQMANQIRNNAFSQKIAAYRSIDPTSLNAGIQNYQNQQQVALSQQPNMANLFSSISPFLRTQPKASFSGVNSGTQDYSYLWKA